jgi:putative oxidoreductase
MGIMHQSYRTGENVPKWIVVLRIVLGLSLIYKGIMFFNNAGALQEYFTTIDILKNFTWTTAFIPWVHIIGGVLILFGLFTRLASLLQIPILFGALIFVNLKDGVYTNNSDLPFSFMILVLVIAFSFVGGGYLSLDDAWRKPLPEKE